MRRNPSSRTRPSPASAPPAWATSSPARRKPYRALRLGERLGEVGEWADVARVDGLVLRRTAALQDRSNALRQDRLEPTLEGWRTHRRRRSRGGRARRALAREERGVVVVR